jgi:hypothetical protein
MPVTRGRALCGRPGRAGDEQRDAICWQRRRVTVFVKDDGGVVALSTRQERSIPRRATGQRDHNGKLCARKTLTTVVFNSIGRVAGRGSAQHDVRWLSLICRRPRPAPSTSTLPPPSTSTARSAHATFVLAFFLSILNTIESSSASGRSFSSSDPPETIAPCTSCLGLARPKRSALSG